MSLIKIVKYCTNVPILELCRQKIIVKLLQCKSNRGGLSAIQSVWSLGRKRFCITDLNNGKF